MHIDLTPAVLVAEREPRTSVIFHSKPEDPSEPKLRLLANPWGLAEWFKVMTPLETDFAKLFEGRAMAQDRAPGEPVLPPSLKVKLTVRLADTNVGSSDEFWYPNPLAA